MRRTGNIAIAAIAVVELAAAFYVVSHNDAPKLASSAAAAQRPPSATAAASASLGIDAAQASRSPATGSVVVAFVGDDWTAGAGASRNGKRFTTLICRRLGLTERNFGVDGTGYAKASDGAGAYLSRLSEIVAARPQVVVVSGGRNDRSDSAETVAHHAHRLFAALHDELPGAVLIAIAPFWGDSDLPPELVALGRAVQRGVEDAGGSYLDVTDPIHDHPELMADDADPNNRGYATIARALEPLLAPLLPR